MRRWSQGMQIKLISTTTTTKNESEREREKWRNK